MTAKLRNLNQLSIHFIKVRVALQPFLFDTMKMFSQIQEVRCYVSQLKMSGKKIGFVPTMGALHHGHLKLVEQSVAENDVTISSIFVNPTQFNNPVDLMNYPRDLSADKSLLQSAGCDAIFAPEVSELYKNPSSTTMSYGLLESTMEGRFRPGHFQGVGVIVAKLFNIISPDRAYFGKKDLQQLTIIKALTCDLNFNVEIIPVETVREPDGLAMSSRNRLLNNEERAIAVTLYKTLLSATASLRKGDSPAEVKEASWRSLQGQKGIIPEYFEIVNTQTLEPVGDKVGDQKVSICVAAQVGKVRLIDNMSVY